jgi:hypothetical protein
LTQSTDHWQGKLDELVNRIHESKGRRTGEQYSSRQFLLFWCDWCDAFITIPKGYTLTSVKPLNNKEFRTIVKYVENIVCEPNWRWINGTTYEINRDRIARGIMKKTGGLFVSKRLYYPYGRKYNERYDDAIEYHDSFDYDYRKYFKVKKSYNIGVQVFGG